MKNEKLFYWLGCIKRKEICCLLPELTFFKKKVGTMQVYCSFPQLVNTNGVTYHSSATSKTVLCLSKEG
jgi:hypothetical protein